MAISPTAAASQTRRSVSTCKTYGAAEATVDWLSDRGFPVEQVSIVGTGLRFIERVSGRLTTGRAALPGAGQGALFGLLWGLLFAAFFTVDGDFLGVIAYSLIVGIVFGGPLGAGLHIAQSERRDFASQFETRADQYEIQADAGFADEAARLIARMPAS